MHGRSTRSNEIGRHQRLAVTRRQSVRCAQAGRRDQGHEQDRGRQVRRPEDIRDVADGHAARNRAGRRRGSAAGLRRRHPGDRYQRDAAGPNRKARRSDVERQGDHVRRVRRQSLARARGRQAVAVEGHAVGDGDDLAPADPLGVGAVDEVDRCGTADAGHEGGIEAAFEAEGRQPAGARRERHRLGRRRQRESGSVTGQADRCHQLRAVDRGAGGGLAVVHGSVAVGVHELALLERGNLGHVDDDVEVDRGRRDRDPGIVIDREVAEGMRQRRDGRDESDGEHKGDGGQDAEDAASHDAEGTPGLDRRMTAPSTDPAGARAEPGRPRR